MEERSGNLTHPAVHRLHLDVTRYQWAVEPVMIDERGGRQRKVSLRPGVLPGESVLKLSNIDLVCAFGGRA